MAKILYGHTFATSESIRDDFVSSIFATDIEKLRSLIQRNQSRFLSLEQSLSKTKPDKDDLILTLDDGYASVYTYVLPLLEKYQVPCILFLTTDFLNGKTAYEIRLANFIANKQEIILTGQKKIDISNRIAKVDTYEKIRGLLKPWSSQKRNYYLQRIFSMNNYNEMTKKQNYYLSWGQAKELANHPLISIGGHTCSHITLRNKFSLSAYREVRDSKIELENNLSIPVTLFSYPYGGNNFITRRYLAATGYEYAFTTKQREVLSWQKEDLFQIPRFDIDKIV
jgi:peptidoglycan/xylan/chitin deacetylase (PgdA/CDA1 family)